MNAVLSFDCLMAERMRLSAKAVLPEPGEPASTATSASFSWDASKMGDIAGYKFYYDTDSSGYPYTNNVDLGNVVFSNVVQVVINVWIVPILRVGRIMENF